MTEFGADPEQEPFQELARTVARLGVGRVRERDFMGRKAAREFMDETGLSGMLSDEHDTTIIDIMGVCISGGIALGMREKTDEDSIAQEIQGLQDQLPDDANPVLERLITVLVPYGIDFYQTELSQGTPKARAGAEEFQLLASLEPPAEQEPKS